MLGPARSSRRHFLGISLAGAAVALMSGLSGYVVNQRTGANSAELQTARNAETSPTSPSSESPSATIAASVSTPASRRKAEIIPDVPKDAIPPLDFPRYEAAADVGYLEEEDFVLGFIEGEDARAYPFKIMNFHEIVNDVIGGRPVVITYCPLCKSGLVTLSCTTGKRRATGGNLGEKPSRDRCKVRE